MDLNVISWLYCNVVNVNNNNICICDNANIAFLIVEICLFRFRVMK